MKDEDIKLKFSQIYTDLSDAIFRYCLLRVSNREVALDLTQDAFLRFWDSYSNGKEIENVKAFLFTISRNLVIDYYRKKKSLSLDAILDETEDSTYFLEDTEILNTELSAEGRFVLEKIKELPETHRQIIYLRFVEGFKPKEIAEIFNVSSNVISVRIVRALEKLREMTGYNIEDYG